MRGCLSVLVLASLFAAAGVWFGGRPAAAFLLDTGLTAGGFRAAEREVVVEADPPFVLVGGRADAVHLRASGVEFADGVTASELDLTLSSVDILGRTFERVDGDLSGVVLEQPGRGAIGPLTLELAGEADSAEATAVLAANALLPLLRGAIESTVGAQPSGITLVAPDRVTFRIESVGANSRFIVVDGGLALRIAVPGVNPETIRLLEPPDALQLTAVRVAPSGLTLSGLLDVAGLIGM